MAWTLIEHRNPKGQQEIRVKSLLKEMCEDTYATYAGAFINHFAQRILEIPRTNNFSADLIFKVIEVELRKVEVWKTSPAGDLKYKMFTLETTKE